MTLVAKALDRLPVTTRETLLLRTFGLVKIPLLLFCMPRVVAFDDEVCSICVPLNWRTKNHLGSMYFGALSVGADCAGGYAAMYHVRRSKRPVSLVFKDFRADFLKRPTGDVLFTTRDGAAMAALVQQAIHTGERVNRPVDIDATCEGETVARFVLTLSLKLRADPRAAK